VCYTTDDPRKRSNVAVFLARPVGGSLAAGDDAVAAEFFSLDALPEKIAFENNRMVLARLMRDHPTGTLL
jgi:hypothetical protein